jgi:hypothetical protein
MSTLETNLIQPATGTTLTLGASGDTLAAGSGVTIGSGLGKILQAVSATDTTERNTTSTTFVTASNTLSVDITPVATSSKIFVIVSTSCYNGTASKAAYLTIYRDASNLGNSNGFVRALNSAGGAGGSGASASILDSPSTTSAITYQAYLRADSGSTAYLNANSSGFITAFEVAG